jgi:DNA-directed RNA polymerase specialized sigma24 family protein
MIKYEDHKQIIVKLAWDFANSEEEKKELIAEGNYQYCLCLMRFDPNKKTKFGTFFYECLFNRFMNLQRDRSRKGITVDVDLLAENVVERNMIFKDSLTNLSENAKEIVKVIFETPDDFYQAAKEEIQVNKRMITDYLISRGWKFQTIWDGFSEINKMLMDI